MAITALYAGLIAILFATLSTITAMTRGTTNVALGDGGNAQMQLSIRRFGNLSEYAAMALVLMLLMELQGIAPRWLHAYGMALLAARLLHPFILFDDMKAPLWKKAGRFFAGAGTALLILAAGITLAITNLG